MAIRNINNRQADQHQGFQPRGKRNDQWTVDLFWEVDRPQRRHPQRKDEPGPPSRQIQQVPMEEGEIGSKADHDLSVLEVPAVDWAKYVGVESVQSIKMGHAPKVDAEEANDWDLGNDVRETEKHFATDLKKVMMETTNDPSLLKTLCWLREKTARQYARRILSI